MTSIIVALIPVIGLLLYGCVNGQGESQLSLSFMLLAIPLSYFSFYDFCHASR